MDFGDGLGIFRREPGLWPDGEPIHRHNVFVKLSCGHHRVSSGWRGSAGEMIFCEACMTRREIMATIITELETYGWREPE